MLQIGCLGYNDNNSLACKGELLNVIMSYAHDITYHSSRYSSLAADTKNVPFVFIQCLSKSLHLARLTFLMLSQGAGHFLKAYIGHVAHSSTGGSEVPAYDRCYILATDIYIIVFRAVPIRIYYTVLIATPEAIRR